MKAKQGLFLIFVISLVISCKSKKEDSPKNYAVTSDSEVLSSNSEWKILFDGSSFDHWRNYLGKNVSSAWVIEKNSMLLNTADHSSNIITKEKFTNFILSLEWKISSGGNSGIFWGIHEEKSLNQPYLTGPEIQVLDNDSHPDAQVNPKYHHAGALYDMVQPLMDVCKPAGEWNTCEIMVNHMINSGSVVLNGTLIVEFPVHGDPWNTLVSKSKFKNWKYFGKYQTGHIGLQDHGDKVWYRNIKIKEL